MYRARLAAASTSDTFLKLEFKKVTQADGTTAKGFGKTEHKTDYYQYHLEGTTPVGGDVAYCDKITYSLTDTGLSTGDSYMYVIVATKAGADPVIVLNPTYLFVKGSN